MREIQNLSEQLFKPKYNYPETSTLINRFDDNVVCDKSVRNNHWYRDINPLSLSFRGLNIIEIKSILARIASSTKPHSRDNFLDTIIGYQSGNWIYEFINQAAKESNIKKDSTANISNIEHQAAITASQYYSLASYPHYKNDELALYAQTCGYKAYSDAFSHSPYQLKILEFTIDSTHCRIKSFLHLPVDAQAAIEKTYPVVLLCGGMGNLQIDFYRYFSQFLAPNGFALLTVDFPTVGYSRSLNLTQNSSQIYQSVLEQIKTVPWIDEKRLILAGIGFGANIATRLAYFEPNKIKGLLTVKPLIHQLFIDKNRQSTLPEMYKDMLASRLGLNNISNEQLSAELNYFSLKNQGIITRPCHVPLFTILFEGDEISTLDEAKLLTSLKQHKIVTLQKGELVKNLQKAINESIKWMIEKL